MNQKVTKYKKICDVKATAIMYGVLFLIALILAVVFITVDFILVKICAGILLLFILGSMFAILKGIIKAKNELRREEKKIEKANPYIYYRELPNQFGIGISSLLLDSTIENEKDIVAVILDLCGKKYLRLNKECGKYLLEVLKPIDGGLLNNEKYVLSCILYDSISNFNFNEWYGYCLEDGIDLGLYERQDIGNRNSPAFQNVFDFEKHISAVNYQNIQGNSLKKTPKGIEEVHKLLSFKAFIKDFGNFVEKSPEEVVLWDRYLSYAQLFGLTEEIMKTGYEELIHNSSFKIDGIDEISFSEIQLEKEA